MTAIGSGIGAGIGFYLGWKGQKDLEEYESKMKNNPEFRKEKKNELRNYIQKCLKEKDYYPDESRYHNLPVGPDVYKYWNLYDKFRQKYYDEWTKAWEDLRSPWEIDAVFDIVFPQPCPEEYYKGTDYSEGFVVANYDSQSDHYWIMWDPKKQEYNNDLGSGRGTGKTLLEASQNFASQWIVDEGKIKEPGILKVAKIHNKIIREFLKLR